MTTSEDTCETHFKSSDEEDEQMLMLAENGGRSGSDSPRPWCAACSRMVVESTLATGRRKGDVGDSVQSSQVSTHAQSPAELESPSRPRTSYRHNL